MMYHTLLRSIEMELASINCQIIDRSSQVCFSSENETHRSDSIDIIYKLSWEKFENKKPNGFPKWRPT